MRPKSIMAALSAAVLVAAPKAAAQWTPAGPGPTLNGQVEGMSSQSNPVAGAIHTVVAHPTDPNTLYFGAVNGGIWKTTNATSASPTWTSLTDFKSSLSIGAMDFDPTDGSRNTLIAGVGRNSSFSRTGGSRAGLLRTTNGGATWTELDGGLAGKNVSGVVARGNTIVASVNTADSFTFGNIGIFRSTDGGQNFARLSGSSGSTFANGLPGGRVYDLVPDPVDNAVLYASIRDAGSNNGIYKSSDTGASWARVSDAAMQALNTDASLNSTVNIEMAVGKSGEVYAAFMGSNGRLTGLFRSGNAGGAWTQLDTPSTNENGTIVGTQPREKEYDISGGQGAIHFSIAADPTNANIVYVGGDRQPGPGEGPTSWPNSIGAQNYTGRLFRVDAAKALGTQAIALTHLPSTNSNSAPHADSREMTFDAAGNILQVDDGGIYKRTNPRSTGDWFSLNGNAQVAEIHSLDYDRNTNTITAGTQDIGTTEQRVGSGSTWYTVNQGDGGRVAIDDRGTSSVRYTSSQYLGNFHRRVVNAAGTTTSASFPALNIVGGGSIKTDPNVQFYGPVAVNAVNGNLYIGTRNVYESSDGGNNNVNLGLLNAPVTNIVAGGKANGVNNADVLFVTTNSESIYRRTTAAEALTNLPNYATTAGSSTPVDLVMDSSDWHNLFVADANSVFRSTDAGDSFTSITGNLADSNLHTMTFIDTGALDFVLVGGNDGVFFSGSDSFGTWLELGAAVLPNAPVWDLVYDPFDDVLVAGTLGRGAWTIPNVSSLLVPEPNSMAILLSGGLFMAARRRRRQVRSAA